MSVDLEYAATAPEFFVADVGRSVAFYAETLGGTLVRQSPDFAIVQVEATTLLLAADTLFAGDALPPPGARGLGVDVRILVAEVDAWYYRLAKARVPIAHGIADRDYGMRDFIIRDPDGYRLRFAAPLAAC